MGKEKGDGDTRPFSLRANVLSEWPLIPPSVRQSVPSFSDFRHFEIESETKIR